MRHADTGGFETRPYTFIFDLERLRRAGTGGFETRPYTFTVDLERLRCAGTGGFETRPYTFIVDLERLRLRARAGLKPAPTPRSLHPPKCGCECARHTDRPAWVLPHSRRMDFRVCPSPTLTRVPLSFSPTFSYSPSAANRASSSSSSGQRPIR